MSQVETVQSTCTPAITPNYNIVPCFVQRNRPIEESSTDTSEEIDNGGRCTKRLSQLCNNPKFSDITLIVDGQKFYAHKLLLANASDVFEQMLTSANWSDSSQDQLVLQEPEECLSVFNDFLSYIYSGQIKLQVHTVLGLLVLADKYNLQDLKSCCTDYMARHLVTQASTNRAVTWYQYAVACGCDQLQQKCFTFMLCNIDSILDTEDWIWLQIDHLISFLIRSDIVVSDEYKLLMGIVRWLEAEHRATELEKNLSLLLPHIRFCMIFPEYLERFEMSEFCNKYHSTFAEHLLQAYRYHALSARGCKQQRECTVLYRNYTDERYSIATDVIRKSYRSCPRVSSKVERALNVPLTVGGTHERQCKLKVTFYPLGYYVTSLWNGQVNLAKSSDKTKMIIAHRGGVAPEEAEVTVLFYASQNGSLFASHGVNHHHVFQKFEPLDIENVIDVECLKDEKSPFIVDGSLCVKVFYRPISFCDHQPDQIVPLDLSSRASII